MTEISTEAGPTITQQPSRRNVLRTALTGVLALVGLGAAVKAADHGLTKEDEINQQMSTTAQEFRKQNDPDYNPPTPASKLNP